MRHMLISVPHSQAEFWFASIKLITIVGLIILGIVLMLGGGPNHDRLGFRYYKYQNGYGTSFVLIF